ncbi:MAG: glycosyltransferase [Pseudomonadota bacterium]
MPRFAVVIPHYNDLDRLMRCLEALMVQDLSETEVIVADNASSVDLSVVAAKFPEVRLVTQPEKGAAAARNKGVEDSQAEWVFFLDADCVPRPGWTLAAKRIAGADPHRITGGQIEVFDETPRPRSGAEAFETVFAFDQESYVRDKGFSVTANLVTSRATFEHVGPMIVGLSEDVEWCRRAVSKGHPLAYDPDLRVAHPTRQDWPALAKKWRRMTEEGFGLNGSGPTRRLIWAARAVLMPLSVLAHLPKVLRHPALSGREKGRAAVMLLRIRLQRMIWMLRQAGAARL